jgi:hypothetical protein
MKNERERVEQEEERLIWLTRGPALATLEGCRARIDHLGLADRWLLCRQFQVDPSLTREESRKLVRRLHTAAKKVRA